MNNDETTSRTTGTVKVKRGLAEMLKGGVIMDVVTPEQAKTLGNTAFDPHSGKQEFFGIHVRRPKKE